jgi:general secretion pathway protein I
MAAFGQVNQSLTVASRLREKTLANWVAVNQMTRLRLLGEFPAIGTRSDEVEMARTTWRYTIKVVKTPLAALRRVDISIAFGDRPDAVVTTLTGFLGRPAQATQGASAAAQADWSCPESPGP